jgi:uncharacterized protein with FMN-binding domain
MAVFLAAVVRAEENAPSLEETLAWLKKVDENFAQPRFNDLTVEKLKTLTDIKVGGHTKAGPHIEINAGDFKFLTALRNLTKANLSEITGLNDEALVYVGKIRTLTDIDLGDAQISYAGVRNLSGLTDLTRLNLGFTANVTDAAMPEIAKFSKLELLVLSGTKVTDAGLDCLKQLPNLTELRLGATGISDGAVASLSTLKTLKILKLSKTKNLSWKAVQTLKDALPECKIEKEAPDPQPADGKVTLPAVKPAIAAAAPVIDGTLDDPIWKQAAICEEFKLPDGSAPKSRTRLYLLRDDNSLYIAFENFDSEEVLKSLKANTTLHGQGDIWRDDSIELFIDPLGKRESYYQFIVNSRGIAWEAFHDSPGSADTTWQPKYEVKAGVGKESWIVTLALPYSIFDRTAAPQTEWTFNAVHTRTVDNEILLWSPVFSSSSHKPDKFGMLQGMPVQNQPAATVVLNDGKKLNGRLIAEGADSITLNINGVEDKLALKQIYTLTANGVRRVITAKAGTEEVEALIASAGSSTPAWWSSVNLNIPSGLDLTWQHPPKGPNWDPSKWLAQYIWTTVNENPSKWKEGIKLLHHTLTVNKNDPVKLKQSMNALATAYAELLGDFPRAAFWWRKGGGGGHGYSNNIALARCYWKMGSKEMAAEALDNEANVTANLVRSWGDLGETDRALKLGESAVKSDPVNFNMALGDVCRSAGLYPQAIKYYESALALRVPPRLQFRLESNRDAAKGAEAFNHLDQVPAGTYAASSVGYVGPVEVTVEVKNGRLESVKVTKHDERQYYSSIADTPARILQKQGIKGVDTTTGATMTSEAIINAAAKAISNAVKQ